MQPAIRENRADQLVSDLRNRNQTRKFLITDMNSALAEQRQPGHENCISCHKCIRLNRNPILFKYSKQMKSTYSSNHIQNRDGEKSESPPRTAAYNMTKMMQEVKVPYSPPNNHITAYQNNFLNRKGTEEVGSLTPTGHNPEPRRKAPKGDLDTIANVPLPFYAKTSNEMAMIDYGRLPTPNKRTHPKLTTGFGRFYG